MRIESVFRRPLGMFGDQSQVSIELDDPAMGRVRLARTPLLFSGWDPVPREPPPQLGEHTDEILGSLPGVSEGTWRRGDPKG